MLAREWQNCPLGDIFGAGQSGEDVGFSPAVGAPMINPHLLFDLTERGLVAQNSDPAALADHLATQRPVY